jgi:hypothetical protein
MPSLDMGDGLGRAHGDALGGLLVHVLARAGPERDGVGAGRPPAPDLLVLTGGNDDRHGRDRRRRRVEIGLGEREVMIAGGRGDLARLHGIVDQRATARGLGSLRGRLDRGLRGRQRGDRGVMLRFGHMAIGIARLERGDRGGGVRCGRGFGQAESGQHILDHGQVLFVRGGGGDGGHAQRRRRDQGRALQEPGADAIGVAPEGGADVAVGFRGQGRDGVGQPLDLAEEAVGPRLNGDDPAARGARAEQHRVFSLMLEIDRQLEAARRKRRREPFRVEDKTAAVPRLDGASRGQLDPFGQRCRAAIGGRERHFEGHAAGRQASGQRVVAGGDRSAHGADIVRANVPSRP